MCDNLSLCRLEIYDDDIRTRIAVEVVESTRQDETLGLVKKR